MQPSELTEAEVRQARKKNRNTLIILAVVFFGPMLVAAYFTYFYYPSHDPAETNNQGVLVDPPRELPAFELSTLDGGRLTLEDLKGKWTVTYIGSGDCPKPCADNLAKIKQARLLQGGELKRINRLYLMAAGEPRASLLNVLKEHPGMRVAKGEEGEMTRVLSKFQVPYHLPADKADRVYIIDPQGFLMMRYPADFNTADLYKDIKHLLRASWFG